MANGAQINGTAAGLTGVMFLSLSGYIPYDTSSIINGGETNYIMATVSLYLDILNLFLALLRSISILSGNDRK